MSEHTPGPWTISVRDWEIMIEANGDDVALIQGKMPRDQANARLIISVHDLYAALSHMLDGRAGCRDEARTALARARGEDR